MSTIENWNSDDLIRNKNELDQNPSSCNDLSGLIKKIKIITNQKLAIYLWIIMYDGGFQ